MTHCLPGEMHELATVLAGAADNAFVSEAVALRLHHVFPLQNLRYGCTHGVTTMRS